MQDSLILSRCGARVYQLVRVTIEGGKVTYAERVQTFRDDRGMTPLQLINEARNTCIVDWTGHQDVIRHAIAVRVY